MTKNKELCYGCSACQQVCSQDAIVMVADEEGFAYPVIDTAKCVRCGRCEQVCPFSPTSHSFTGLSEPDVYACWNHDAHVRTVSSSGGIFSVLAAEMIRRDGIVFGACFDERFNVRHESAADLAGCQKFRGSKYVQSDIADTYQQVATALSAGQDVLFSGTPCQNAGLHAFLGKTEEKLVTCDLLCTGAPSPFVFRQLRQHLESLFQSPIVSFRFRDKEQGWNTPTLRVDFANGQVFRDRLFKNVYAKLFFEKFSARPTCIECKFKETLRVADFTLGDYWHGDKVKPHLFDNRGVSLVLVNSEKGRRLFEHIQGSIFSESARMAEMQQRQLLFRPPSQRPAKRIPPIVRAQFFRDVSRGFAGIDKRYFLYHAEIFLLKVWNSLTNVGSQGGR